MGSQSEGQREGGRLVFLGNVGKARQGCIPSSLSLPSHGSNWNRRDVGLREGRGEEDEAVLFS